MWLLFWTSVVCVTAAKWTSSKESGWSSCEASNGKVLDVRVSPSGENDIVYGLRRGTNVTLEVDFWSSVASSVVKARSYAIVLRMPVPLTMPHDNLCDGVGIRCPLEAGNVYTYSQAFEVKSCYPKTKVTVKWTAVDENGAAVACVVIPVQIVD